MHGFPGMHGSGRGGLGGFRGRGQRPTMALAMWCWAGPVTSRTPPTVPLERLRGAGRPREGAGAHEANLVASWASSVVPPAARSPRRWQWGHHRGAAVGAAGSPEPPPGRGRPHGASCTGLAASCCALPSLPAGPNACPARCIPYPVLQARPHDQCPQQRQPRRPHQRQRLRRRRSVRLRRA